MSRRERTRDAGQGRRWNSPAGVPAPILRAARGDATRQRASGARFPVRRHRQMVLLRHPPAQRTTPTGSLVRRIILARCAIPALRA